MVDLSSAAAFMMNCKYRASYNDIKKVLELDSDNTKVRGNSQNLPQCPKLLVTKNGFDLKF